VLDVEGEYIDFLNENGGNKIYFNSFPFLEANWR
jgi:hypothetical protein